MADDDERLTLDDVQAALDLVGVVPVLGDTVDAINGTIYLFRGQPCNAAIFVPFATGPRAAVSS